MIIGLDPSLTCTGICVVTYEGRPEQNVKLGWIKTEPQSKKRRIFSGDDDVRRLKLILDAIEATWAGESPPSSALSVDVVAEMPAGSQSYRGAVVIGMMVGWITTWCYDRNLQLRWVTPSDVKVALAGKKGASKDEMVVAAVRLLSSIPNQGGARAGSVVLPKATKPGREAMADALGVVIASGLVPSLARSAARLTRSI